MIGSVRQCSVLIGLAVLLASPAAEAAADCAGLLEVHGFLRWAANRCAFTAYNPAMVVEARQCFDWLGSTVAAPHMYAGRDRFARMDALQSHTALCAEIARKFSDIVR